MIMSVLQVLVGAGLQRDGFTQNQAAVSRDICLFLEVFYGKLFPELLQSDLYVAGESYGGKFVPALSAYIDRYNKEPGFHSDNSPKFLIPLQGFIIGDGLTDPFSQIMYYAPHALALGLVSESQAQLIRRIATLSIAYGKQNPPDWDRATAARNLVFEVLRNASGNVNLYDMRKGSVSNDWSNMEKFLHVPQVVASLNVFSTPIEDQAAGKASLKAKLASPIEFWKDPRVYLHMYADVMKSTAFLVSDLLDLKRADSLNPDSFLKVGEHEQEWRVEAENSGMNSWNNYKVLLFQGQFDFRDGIWGSTEWIEKLDWSGQIGYRSAQRKIWSFDGHVAGYVTEHRNLKRVELLQAGHLAPMDQGARAKFMIESFVG
ncbi:Alpha/Beta hydrolase protein [Cladochytrium replicatum]|nr:Alpha/Beta hydrolase protein [Cladochytrium replicatum]